MTKNSCFLVFCFLCAIISVTIIPITCAWTYFIGTNIDVDQYPTIQDVVDAVNFCTSILISTDLNRILKYKEICGKIINIINQNENGNSNV
uniref:Uncharacterized protein n=1 Tax=Strongyloides stercoralis TaxID=6248 RepID=A0A0K0EGA1_STRER